MKLFFVKSVNKGVLTYFKDVFLAGQLRRWSRFFFVVLLKGAKVTTFDYALSCCFFRFYHSP